MGCHARQPMPATTTHTLVVLTWLPQTLHAFPRERAEAEKHKPSVMSMLMSMLMLMLLLLLLCNNRYVL